MKDTLSDIDKLSQNELNIALISAVNGLKPINNVSLTADESPDSHQIPSTAEETQVIKDLVEHGADINCTYPVPVLTLAAEKGHKDVVELFIKAGAEVNKASWDGNTALILAAKEGHTDIVELLIKNMAYINKKDILLGYTALMHAASYGHEGTVKVLIQAKAQVNTSCRLYGDTALIFAAFHGYKDVVELLIKAGAEVDKTSREYGDTPLMLAAKKGHKDIVELLIKARAYIDKKDQKQGYTALMFAAEQGHTDIVELLIKAGAKVVNIRGKLDQSNALMLAAKKGYKDIVIILSKFEEKNTYNITLMFAAEQGHTDVVETLIQTGASVNRQDWKGYTALMSAAKNGHLDTVISLIKLGADVNIRNSDDKKSALELTNVEGIKYLINKVNTLPTLKNIVIQHLANGFYGNLGFQQFGEAYNKGRQYLSLELRDEIEQDTILNLNEEEIKSESTAKKMIVFPSKSKIDSWVSKMKEEYKNETNQYKKASII